VTHEAAFPFGSFELCQEVAAGIPHAEFLIVNENSIAGRDHDENVAAIDRFLRTGTVASLPATPVDAVRPSYVDTLTPREVQVLQQVASGATNKEIAVGLGVAVSTVERHLVNLYAKIGARGRVDAVAFAVRHGVGRPS
jgi:DNA-binding CsgD family transcriptional regulator